MFLLIYFGSIDFIQKAFQERIDHDDVDVSKACRKCDTTGIIALTVYSHILVGVFKMAPIKL